MGAPQAPPPGWYPDPTGVPRQVWWDGSQWHIPPPPRISATPGWKKWALAGIGAAVILTLIAFGATRHDVDKHSAGTSTGGDFGVGFTGDQPAAMNTVVADGEFSFRVTGMTVDDGYAIVSLTVMNTGDEPQTYFANNQKLFDAQGREYGADTMKSRPWTQQMNPGFQLPVSILFPVPPGV